MTRTPFDSTSEQTHTLERSTVVKELGAAGHVRVTDRPPAQMSSFGDRYVRREVLGEGGMGLVELLEDRQIGRAVAVKSIRPEHRQQSVATARFLREARIQGQLEHPAVVPVYDIGIEPDGSVYFTMKRVRGTTLHDVLSVLKAAPQAYLGKYSRRRLLTAFGSVCLAVDYAHQHGVVHRDLKPANVMLGDYGEVYVLDWGLARVDETDRDDEVEPIKLAQGVPHATHAGAVMGTPGYMSPEQIKGDLDAVGPRSDVYSLGAILFELLTGEPLHADAKLEDIIESTIRGVEARPSMRVPESDIAPELEATLVKATALDPNERFTGARELYESIERYLDGEKNLELRHNMAAVHTQNAIEAVKRARKGTSLGLHRDRREALRQIGRALALDPDNEKAMSLLMKLLAEPALKLPPEVKTEMASNERHRLRWISKIGAFAYLHIVIYLPFMIWLGVRRWDWLSVFFIAGLIASGLSFWVSKQRLPSKRVALVVMLFSNLSLASTAAIFGPLFLTPMLIALNAVGFTIYFDEVNRRYALGAALVAVLLPMGVWLAGWLPGGYEFTPQGILIRPGLLQLHKAPIIVLACMANLAAVVMGGLIVTRVRDALQQTERQIFLYAWHLREFVPIAARAATDPTAERRGAS